MDLPFVSFVGETVTKISRRIQRFERFNPYPMTQEPKHRPFMTPTEVAALMMVSPITVRGWSQKGLLKAEVTPGGHRRYLREEVERFMRDASTGGRRTVLRVLIIDDEPAVLGQLRDLIESASPSAQVELAQDGFEAGRKVQSYTPDWILLDDFMPGLISAEVARRIIDMPKMGKTRIVGLSDFSQPERQAELSRAGVALVLRKPVDPLALLSTLGLDA
jgi:excisionase family DNA binding protein